MSRGRIDAYTAWVRNDALPVWASRGFDADRGRFRERLDRAGAPLAVPHRAMVQARQIYTYAHAATLGWFPQGAALAETAMASLLATYLDEGEREASFAFSVGEDGRIVSAARDAYTHAFVIFAMAWLFRLNGDGRLLALADKTAAFIDARLVDPVHGGLFDALPVVTRDKRQNPLMHLLEAYLFMERAAPGQGYLDRADAIVALFERRLFHARPGALLEYFAEDWQPHPDPAKGAMFEPGHHFEWVWLLGEYAALGGRAADRSVIERWSKTLYAHAVGHGCASSGLVWDEVGLDMAPARRAHRLWPHTEGIKAAIARDAAGDADAPALAEAFAGHLLDTFLGHPFAGGWTDQVGEDGVPAVDYVPASSLYHIFLAAAEAAGPPSGRDRAD